MDADNPPTGVNFPRRITPGGLRALGKRGIFRYRTHEEADSAAIEDMARARRPLFRAKR